MARPDPRTSIRRAASTARSPRYHADTSKVDALLIDAYSKSGIAHEVVSRPFIEYKSLKKLGIAPDL